MDLNPLLRLKENLLQIHENTSAMQSKMRVSGCMCMNLTDILMEALLYMC